MPSGLAWLRMPSGLAWPRKPRQLARDVLGAPPGTLVAGMIAAALITVGVLASQASDAGTDVTGPAGAAGPEGGRSPAQAGLPPGSGFGVRVVYSPSRKKVWLVGEDEQVRRAYRVVAGDTAPPQGVHKVFARRAHGVGGDGAQVEHAVFFADREGANVGFSAPLKGLAATRKSTPAKLGAAIREERRDGYALWVFATVGRIVDVVP